MSEDLVKQARLEQRRANLKKLHAFLSNERSVPSTVEETTEVKGQRPVTRTYRSIHYLNPLIHGFYEYARQLKSFNTEVFNPQEEYARLLERNRKGVPVEQSPTKHVNATRGHPTGKVKPITKMILEEWEKTHSLEKTARATHTKRKSMEYAKHLDLVKRTLERHGILVRTSRKKFEKK